jgi:hypothetical protein
MSYQNDWYLAVVFIFIAAVIKEQGKQSNNLHLLYTTETVQVQISVSENAYMFVKVLVIKPTRCTISQVYFYKVLYMFQTDLLSIIRSQ